MAEAHDMQAEAAFWAARGVDIAPYVGGAPTAPAGGADAVQTPPAPSPADQLKGFLPANVGEAARHAVASGAWTKEQAKIQLEGYDAAAIDLALADVTPESNEDIKTLNAGGFQGAQSAAEIGPVSYLPETIAHLSPAELMRFDGEIKQAAIDMGVPASGAAPWIKTVADAAYKVQAMQAAERAAWAETQKAQMVSALGVDGAKDMHAKAAAAFALIKNTDLMANLHATGVLDDMFVVWTLAQATNVAAVRAAVRGGESLAGISNKQQGA